MRNQNVLDEVLQRISLSFGVDSVELIIPEDFLTELSLYQISKIDVNDLDNELVYQSKIYTLFSVLLAYVTDKYNRADAALAQLESSLALQYERQLISRDERISDKKIEKLVDSDEQYVNAVQQKLHFKQMVVTFDKIVASLEQRSNMLQQLSAKRNKEIGSRMA